MPFFHVNGLKGGGGEEEGRIVSSFHRSHSRTASFCLKTLSMRRSLSSVPVILLGSKASVLLWRWPSTTKEYLWCEGRVRVRVRESERGC